MTYRWECTGGVIVGNKEKATWSVPSKVGTFTVKVTVSDGKDSVSVSKDFEVLGSYYYDFNQVSSLWGKSNTNTTLQNGILTVTNTDGTNLGVFGCTLPTTQVLPFSVKTRVAVNMDNFSSGSSARASFYYYFEAPTSTTNSYLSTLVFHVRPGLNSWEVRAGIYNPQTAQVEYQQFSTTSISTASTPIFTESNQYHTIGIAITSDKYYVINIDGNELFRSNALSTEAKYNGDLKVRRFAYIFDPGISLLIDDYCQTTDETILK